MKLRVEDVTPALVVKNEDYWIHYTLRGLLMVFDRVLMIDTGSTDWTREIARGTAIAYNTDFVLVEEDFGDDAYKISNSWNVLREMCETEWLFVLGGDEIWREHQLHKLIEFDVPDDKLVVMTLGRNLTVNGDKLVERDEFNADRLFRPSVEWTGDYPFEGHGLDEKARLGQLIYTDAYFWHVRHLTRSSRDADAYFRDAKRQYYPWDGPLKEIPSDWLGDLAPFPNPYLGV